MSATARVSGALRGAALVTLLAAPAGAQQPAAEEPSRLALRELGGLLDGAVRRAVGPGPLAAFPSPFTPRGYRIGGEGAFIVLPPVSVPQAHGVVVLQGSGGAGADLDDVARQVREMEREAERARREAELAFERVRHQIQARLGEDGGALPPSAPGAEAPPPWSFWFRFDEPGERPDPARVVADVRAALGAALAEHGAGLGGLARDEFLAVAIDFVDGGLLGFGTSSSRTLVARLSAGDLAAHRAGRIDAEELRSRIAWDEY